MAREKEQKQKQTTITLLALHRRMMFSLSAFISLQSHDINTVQPREKKNRTPCSRFLSLGVI